MYTNIKIVSAYSSNTYTFIYLGKNKELIESSVKLKD